MLKKKLGVDELKDGDLLTPEGKALQSVAQVQALEEEFDRIKTLKSKVHFFYYIKHFNTFSFQKAYPDIVKANKGDDSFELIALTNKPCDIDDYYQYLEYDGKKKFLSFTKKEIFSCLKQILDTHR